MMVGWNESDVAESTSDCFGISVRRMEGGLRGTF